MNMRAIRPGVLDLSTVLEVSRARLEDTGNFNMQGDIFSSEMLVESEESLHESGDNYDISLDDDFSSASVQDIEFMRSKRPDDATGYGEEAERFGDDDAFEAYDRDLEPLASDAKPPADFASSDRPLTDDATIMFDLNEMEGTIDLTPDDGVEAAAQVEDASADLEFEISDMTLETEDTLASDLPAPDTAGIARSTEGTEDMTSIDELSTLLAPQLSGITLQWSDIEEIADPAPPDSMDVLAAEEAEEVHTPELPMSSEHTIELVGVDPTSAEVGTPPPAPPLEVAFELTEIDLESEIITHGPAETEFELDLIETETAPPPLQNRADPDEDDLIIELDELDLEDDDMTFS